MTGKKTYAILYVMPLPNSPRYWNTLASATKCTTLTQARRIAYRHITEIRENAFIYIYSTDDDWKSSKLEGNVSEAMSLTSNKFLVIPVWCPKFRHAWKLNKDGTLGTKLDPNKWTDYQ